MEASDQRSKPSWVPSKLDADGLRDSVRGLKELKDGDSRAEAAASLKQSVRGIKDRLPAGPGGGGTIVPRDAAGATAPPPPFEERPELYVGAAFAGGLVLAGVLRLLGR